MKTPTSWMVNEMETDVATGGFSTWHLDGTRYDMNEEHLILTREKDDLSVADVVSLVKPFFEGRHMNTITNNHDGTYRVKMSE